MADYKKLILLILLFLLFVVNPFFVVLLVFFVAAIENNRHSILPKLAFISSCLLAVLIQLQRVWSEYQPSDWVSDAYKGLFLAVEYTGFFDYVFMQKEPVWNILNVIGYYVTGGSAFYFLNSVAITTIVLTLVSIYRYWQQSKACPLVLVASLLFIVFFVEYTSILNNLLRQFFALSIIVFAFTLSDGKRRESIVILTISAFIHNIGIIFLLLYLIKPLHERIDFNRLLKLIGVAIVFSILLSNASLFQSVFSKIPFINYLFGRVSNASFHQLNDLIEPSVIFVNGSVVIALALLMLRNKNLDKKMILFGNLLITLMLISMVTVTVAPMLMTRVYISRFFFFPFVIPYIFYNINSGFLLWMKLPFLWAIIMFFVFWYFTRFDSIRGGGFFPLLDEMTMYSLFNFLF